jgi:photosystem II PsbM protein
METSCTQSCQRIVITLLLLLPFFAVVSTSKAAAGAAFNLKHAAAAAVPIVTIAAPAFALDSIIEMLPTNTVASEVQFGAYLAVLLGTFLPVLFLISLYIQTESRKAGRQ